MGGGQVEKFYYPAKKELERAKKECHEDLHESFDLLFTEIFGRRSQKVMNKF